MGCRNREFSEDETCSSTLSEALLFATMCLIGLPVEVHIKDGSVYSGIFHTACVENEYGVVLKKARMTKKGKRNVNVDDGVVIDTLIVLSGDLVQVVATEVLLPAGSFSKSLAVCDNESMVNDPTSLLPATETKTCMESFKEGSQINQTSDLVQDQNGFAHGSLPTVTGKQSDVRQLLGDNVENNKGDAQQKKEGSNCKKPEGVTDAAINWRRDPDNQLKKEQDDHGQEFDLHKGANGDRVQSSILSEKPCTERSISANTTNAYSVGVSTSSRSSVDSSMDSCRSSITSTIDMAPSHGSESNKSGKEFKLNPRAKLFSPSNANIMPANHATPVAANLAYISNNSPPVVPSAVIQPELDFSPFVPRSSVPAAKFVPYGNSLAGFDGNVAQFSQPMVGHVGTRTQPLRYVGQYPLQAGPTFGPQNSSAVMVSRFGQLVYMQPVSHDLAQGATVVSPVPPCPLLTTQPAQYPKHQGTAAAQALQFCVPPPFMASGHQPLAAVPNHIPILQPSSFPLNRPMPMPGTNAFFTTKF
ncbi:polyadenylate-binding protein-interacting protein 4-like [Cucurbita maxima]|uniref:Polyadenylate-binding protein-interacting protein 4-like n=1 Tax=Cucurbita maxima TaxID=3661 RepID=A0A6J1IG89_CUCMA|nr:polyadenylate-binding protein-interacting protein 4-like [Cucurbita maxima]